MPQLLTSQLVILGPRLISLNPKRWKCSSLLWIKPANEDILRGKIATKENTDLAQAYVKPFQSLYLLVQVCVRNEGFMSGIVFGSTSCFTPYVHSAY